MNEPVVVATAETVAFLTAHLPPAARLIQVRCGESCDAAITAANTLEDEARRARSAQIAPIGRRLVGTLRVR